MDASLFSPEIRLLICRNCGAPLPAPREGGIATCEYCEASSEVAPRPRPVVPAATPRPEPLTEAERIQHLRLQDGKPLHAPSTLPLTLQLWHRPDDPKKAALATQLWQQARAALSSGAGKPSDERQLYFLTLALDNYWALKRDDRRRRALLETALESCTEPLHLQVLRCEMAGQARRLGDLDAAEAWLAPCDPRPHDLNMDSALRRQRAAIATARGDFAAVLELLGAEIDEIPIADLYDHSATMLRANAHERRGDVARATAQLEQAVRSLRGSPRIFARIAAAAAEPLCPRSLPPVHRRALTRWWLRYALFLAVWLGGLGLLAAEPALGITGLGWWSVALAVPLLVAGLYPYFRWRPW